MIAVWPVRHSNVCVPKSRERGRWSPSSPASLGLRVGEAWSAGSHSVATRESGESHRDLVFTFPAIEPTPKAIRLLAVEENLNPHLVKPLIVKYSFTIS